MLALRLYLGAGRAVRGRGTGARAWQGRGAPAWHGRVGMGHAYGAFAENTWRELKPFIFRFQLRAFFRPVGAAGDANCNLKKIGFNCVRFNMPQTT